MYEIGIILKGVGGYYTVLLDNGGTVVAKPRGKFRLDGVSPICGDRVALQQERDGCAFMTEIFKRRNVLTRPAVANIDQLVIVLSL
ncbi:MAG: ribosome small subunit-dependent GTPase A, partial [Clostridiales bacterium]|nr:ribosome small subunit-dependent GTPase A [Clostridiales bacterium]